MATLSEKMIKCGRAGCPSCPHGPYLYRFERINGKLKCTYLGAMTKQQYLEHASRVICPIDAETMQQARSVLAQTTYLMALDVLELCDNGEWDREDVRKKVNNRLDHPHKRKAGDPTPEECFVAICTTKGWKLPKSIKNRKVGA